MTGDPNEIDSELSWEDHCQEAVKKFLMNAVVIDNNPAIYNTKKTEGLPSAQPSDDGMGTNDFEANFPETDAKTLPEEEPVQIESQSKDSAKDDDSEEYEEVKREFPEDTEPSGRIGQYIDIRKLSDAFAEKGISCSFVLPDDHDDSDRAKKNKRILNAVIPSDIVIIDWLLENDESTITVEILKEIAKQDSERNGRMRLICVYTGKPLIENIVNDAKNALEEGGLKIESCDKENGVLKGNDFRLIVLTKDKSEEFLPGILIENFAHLVTGILPSFALASVAAIRRNMHHIITKFSDDLDAPYVANRLITDPPEDVAELIKDLFISECNAALEIEDVTKNYLELSQVVKWIDKQTLKEKEYHVETSKKNEETNEEEKVQEKICIDKNFLTSLSQYGVINDYVQLKDETVKYFPQRHRHKISFCFHSNKKEAIEAEKKFSRLVVMKHELNGDNKIKADTSWSPILTIGSILYKVKPQENEYYYCVTPACDTLRLKGRTTNFLFLRLDTTSDSKGKVNLIIADKDGVSKRRYINPSPNKIIAFPFKGDEECGRVTAKREQDEHGEPYFVFETAEADNEKLYWIGEVRQHRANKDMAELNKQWLRFGINDSEYLRLAGLGMAPFK